MQRFIRFLYQLGDGYPIHQGIEAGYNKDSDSALYHAAALAQLVAGVTNVQNDLIVEPDFVPDDGAITVDLARLVHHALIADARTATAVIDFVRAHDTIILQGTVDSAEIRRCTEEITLEQPHVTAVDNRLTITQWGMAPTLHYGAALAISNAICFFSVSFSLSRYIV